MSRRQIERTRPHREAVQHELRARYRKRRIGRQARYELLGREPSIVVNLVDQSHRSRLLGGVAVARIPDTFGVRDTDKRRQPLDASNTVYDGKFGRRNTDRRDPIGETKVACQGKMAASAQTI